MRGEPDTSLTYVVPVADRSCPRNWSEIGGTFFHLIITVFAILASLGLQAGASEAVINASADKRCVA